MHYPAMTRTCLDVQLQCFLLTDTHSLTHSHTNDSSSCNHTSTHQHDKLPMYVTSSTYTHLFNNAFTLKQAEYQILLHMLHVHTLYTTTYIKKPLRQLFPDKAFSTINHIIECTYDFLASLSKGIVWWKVPTTMDSVNTAVTIDSIENRAINYRLQTERVYVHKIWVYMNHTDKQIQN